MTPAPAGRLPPPDLVAAFTARYERLLQALRPERLGPEADPDAVAGTWAAADRGRELLVATSVRELEFAAAAFVQKKLQEAALARQTLVIDRWPRPDPASSPAAAALDRLVAWAPELPGAEPLPPRAAPEIGPWIQLRAWPVDAAPLEVARWAREALDRLLPERGTQLVADVEDGRIPAEWLVDGLRVPAAGLAMLFLAEQEVRTGLSRKSMAIDASKTHHDLVGGMRDWPKDGRRHRGAGMESRIVRDGDTIERIELLAPGSAVQLHLPIVEMEGMQDSAVEALRRLRGSKGLRHWAALQRLFSVEGGRSGKLRWFLDEHLEALGYDERQRRDPAVRAEAAREVEALAGLELAIYTRGGVLRERRRLLLETGRFERRDGARWKLDGIEFQFNERVYGGVRESTGEIGRNWMPAPVEIAQVDHVRFPYAHALGLLLAIRFRWRLNEAEERLELTGERLLRLSGIPYEARRAERAWTRLQKSLDELTRVGQLASYTWVSPDEAWTLPGVCVLTSAQWLVDRAARGVLPEERPVDPDRPTTGTELRTWRERRGWSQRETAKRLKITQPALSQAEAKGDLPLGPRIEAALKDWFEADEDAVRLIEI